MFRLVYVRTSFSAPCRHIDFRWFSPTSQVLISRLLSSNKSERRSKNLLRWQKHHRETLDVLRPRSPCPAYRRSQIVQLPRTLWSYASTLNRYVPFPAFPLELSVHTSSTLLGDLLSAQEFETIRTHNDMLLAQDILLPHTSARGWIPFLVGSDGYFCSPSRFFSALDV